MADRTAFVEVAFRCPLQHEFSAPRFGVVDARYRPELVPQLVAESTWSTTCPTCGAAGERQDPLVLVSGRRVVVGVVVAPALLRGALLDWIDALTPPAIDENGAWLAVADGAVAALVATRDVDADLRAVADSPDEDGDSSAVRYRNMLRGVAKAVRDHERLQRVGEALTSQSPDDLLELLRQHPELLDDHTATLLEQRLAEDGDKRWAYGLALVRTARADPAEAWRRQQDVMTEVGNRLVSAFAEWEARLDGAMSDPAQLKALADEALEFAQATNAPADFTAHVLDRRASAQWRMADQSHGAEGLLGALADYEAALGLTPEGDAEMPGRMMNAAVAHGRVPSGDVQAHLRRAVDLLEDALRAVGNENQALRTQVETNLAQALLRVERGSSTGVRRACELLRHALTYRRVDRNPVDWAYSQINLGVALERLAALGNASVSDAMAQFDLVLDEAERVGPELSAQARCHKLLIAFDAVGREAADGSVDPARWLEIHDLANEVVDDPGASPAMRGRALWRLGRAQSALGDEAGAGEAWFQAVELLEGHHPSEALDAASDLGALAAASADWSTSSVAYRKALVLADALAQAPSDDQERRRLVAGFGRLHRWAAHALLEVGSPEEALLAVESGRMRELRRAVDIESPELEALRIVAPALAAEWQSLRAGEIGSVDDDGADRHDRLLAAIRKVPGFAGFGGPVTLSLIAAAAEPRRPWVFINPTPWGTDFLVAEESGQVSAKTLPVTSRQIVFRVLFGDDRLSELDDEAIPGRVEELQLASYTLATAAADEEAPSVADALDGLLPWIGERIARDLADLLDELGAVGATVAACGPLSTVPLHAAVWADGETLLDSFELAATPSATVHAAAHRRAARSEQLFSKLVAIADPTDDLPGTRREVAAIRGRFAASAVAEGPDADAEFLRANAAAASVLHIAGHGFGNMVDGDDSGFLLADGVLTAAEIAALGPLKARLAVASACQSGLIEIGDEADEAFNLGTALLFAGAAAAIASLWPVDDLATAMLMTRTYEELAGGGTPVAALSKAQRWLRTLPEQDLDEFLGRHPILAQALRRRQARARLGEEDEVARLAHPECWAAFVVVGA